MIVEQHKMRKLPAATTWQGAVALELKLVSLCFIVAGLGYIL